MKSDPMHHSSFNLQTFFSKFDQFADAPDAVMKMRELVLALAIRGGLVPNAPSEAAVPYDLVEDVTPINVSQVPENWRVVLLADAIKNRSGNSKLIKGKLHEEPAAGRFQGFSASGADVWCDDYEHEGQAIIISAVGARCGKAFKAAGKWSAIANTNIARPEPTLFDFDFAYLVLNNEHFWVRGGSAQPFVKFPPSLDRHFALPPLAEQKRIVAKVDELMGILDEFEEQQKERETQKAALARASLARFADAPTPANLNFLFHSSFNIHPSDLRKSILTLAVQGKLVPQDPNDEPAEELSEIESLFEIPASWQWKGLGTLGLCRTGRTPPTSDPSNYGVGFPFIGPGQITPSGNITASEKTITRKGLGNSTEANASDILMVCIGGSIGKAAICREPLGFNQQINSVRLERDMPEFVYLAVTSEYFQEQVLANASGSATPIINKGKWERIPVPIPPLAEQRRIVAKVEQLMALVDELEAQHVASRATGEKLLAALVAELTAGKESHAAA